MQKDTDELNNELIEAKGVEGFLEDNQENFREYTLSEYLELLMEEKHMTKAEVIAKSELEQVYAYHIFAGRKKKPARNKILALALALELTPEEAQRLLYYAGCERLYVRSSWDSVILYALQNNMSVIDTEALLLDLTEKPLLANE